MLGRSITIVVQPTTTQVTWGSKVRALQPFVVAHHPEEPAFSRCVRPRNMCMMVALSWPVFIMRTGGSPILFSPLKLKPQYMVCLGPAIKIHTRLHKNDPIN